MSVPTRLFNVTVTEGSLVDKGANQHAKVLLFKRETEPFDKQETKREDGQDFPRQAFAYTPGSPATWKMRLWDSLEEHETAAQVGRAMAALGPGGFRGNRVQIPAEDMAGVKAKVRAAWRKTHPDMDMADMPSVLKSEGGDPVEHGTLQKWMTAIAKKLGLTLDDVEKMEYDMPKTTRQMMEHRKAMEEFSQLRGDFMNSLRSIMENPDHDDHAEMLQRSVKEFAEAAEPIMARMHMEDMQKAQELVDDLDASVDDVAKLQDVIKAFTGSDKATDDLLGKQKGSESQVTFEEAVKALGEDQRKVVEAELAKRDGRIAELEKVQKSASDDVAKRFEAMQEEIKKANDRVEKAEQAATIEKELRVQREFSDRAKQYDRVGKADELAKELREAYGVSEDFGKRYEARLAAVQAQIAKGNLFGEAGRSAEGGNAGDAWAAIEAGGAQIAKAKGIHISKGISEYLGTDEGRAAYAEYRREGSEN